jgi:uncharacterized membrane protein
MRRSTLVALTLALAFLGIADAWYLAQHALTNTALYCGIDTGALSGCNTVAQSTYSHFFGIPLGVYGVIYYAVVFIICAILYTTHHPPLTRLLFILGVIGALFSFYFVGLQIFVIKAVCVYCFASFFLSLGIFWTTLMLVRYRPAAPPVM